MEALSFLGQPAEGYWWVSVVGLLDTHTTAAMLVQWRRSAWRMFFPEIPR